MNRLSPALIVRALRLPFIGASLLPFIAGTLLAPPPLRWWRCAGGAWMVVLNHLGANLINDYADSQTGVDWKDKRFFGFFGGSKLIQAGVLTEAFYRNGALLCFALAGLVAVLLAWQTRTPALAGLYVLISVLSWGYSARPFRFSYHRLGECVIFVLFGPAIVMGAYTLQTGVFPAWDSLVLSLPFGLLTAAILFVNEVPDYPDDLASGKYTWVSVVSPARAFVLYDALLLLAFASIVLNLRRGILGAGALLTVLLVPAAYAAREIARLHPHDKAALVGASKRTILIQAAVSGVIIFDLLLRR